MGNNLIKFGMKFSHDNVMFKLLDKVQVIVGCNRTRIGRIAILVVKTYVTINAITSLIQLKNQ